ncbi:hypothetical protein FHG87_007074 [Trinorchestia longiramus]|nr:hypothetical protein FHG87_007074 [Trinorchestia longiramus]
MTHKHWCVHYHLVNSEDLCPSENISLIITEFVVSRLSSLPDALYVFSTQEDLATALDPLCMVRNVKNLPQIDTFDMKTLREQCKSVQNTVTAALTSGSVACVPTVIATATTVIATTVIAATVVITDAAKAIVNSEDLCPCESFLLVNTEFKVSRLSSSPGEKMRLIILVLCLASAASAAFTTFYWCDSGEHYTDPFVLTQQVRPLYTKEMSLIGMDSTLEPDLSLSCQVMLIAEMANGTIVLAMSAVDADGNGVRYLGNLTMQNDNKYMTIAPLGDDFVGPFEDFPDGVFNVKENDETRFYLSYLSDTEVVIRTCRKTLFGSNHALYVFSTQADLVTTLDSECMKESVNNLRQIDLFDMKIVSKEDHMACQNP